MKGIVEGAGPILVREGILVEGDIPGLEADNLPIMKKIEENAVTFTRHH